MNSVEAVLSVRARLGEGPLWDPRRERLFWVDIYNHRVHEFDPSDGHGRHLEIDDLVCALALASGDRLLVALSDRLALLHLSTGDVEVLREVEFPHENTRFNDGKCDARGRFWIGAICGEPGQAELYRFDPDGSLQVQETGLTISNGLGWSPDGGTFYLTDSPTRRIYAYRFDEEAGALGDRRVLIDLGDEPVEPDGLTVDAHGDLWVALWDGWSIAHFSSTGQELERIRMPVQRPTSVAFGGPAMTDLYVTSASVGLSQAEIQRGFHAGDLFRISVGVTGLESHSFALRDA